MWQNLQCSICTLPLKGGFTILRHDEIQDITPSLLAEFAVKCVESDLQSVTFNKLNGASAKSQVGARLDVWGGRFQKTYFEVRVFYHITHSNRKEKTAGGAWET